MRILKVRKQWLELWNHIVEIQARFKKLTEILLASDKHFTLGMHDPELIDWVQTVAVEKKDLMELGFLKCLADETKLEMINDDWVVSEYIPFGSDTSAYVLRRERYLKELAKLGRRPIN